MRIDRLTVPIAAIAIALGSFSAQAQERAERRTRADQDRGAERPQSDDFARPRGGGGDRNRASADRGEKRADPSARPPDRQAKRGGSQGYGRGGSSAPRGSGDRGRSNDRYQTYGGGRGDNHGYRGGSGYGYRGRDYGYRSYGYRGAWGYANGYAYSPYYYAPRPLPYRYAPRRYYGSGGHLSIYFGFGSGYLYGAPYSGRVYGYRAPASSWAGDRYYGDIRLLVDPPDAEVYVDGYYAGIVDDFDGQYQRLALEAGPHKIEIGGRGVRPQVFDVYVDPSRTVELRADLLR